MESALCPDRAVFDVAASYGALVLGALSESVGAVEAKLVTE